MSIPNYDLSVLDVDDFNLYEEEATDHAFARYETRRGRRFHVV